MSEENEDFTMITRIQNLMAGMKLKAAYRVMHVSLDFDSNMRREFRILMLIALGIVFLFSPDVAMAAAGASGTGVTFSGVLQALQTIVTVLLLPIAILLAGWRIIYLAVVCGLFGIDPLNMITDSDEALGDDNISWSQVKEQIKSSLSGFFKGLVWIGAMFVIFQVVLTMASLLATQFSSAFTS